MSARFAATYEATPQSVAVVRNQMAALARDCGLDERTVGDVKLAVSEAATNALVHAYRHEPGSITVRAVIDGDELLISVRDRGRGMAPRPDSPGAGLGLPVIANLARHFEIVEENPGTELRMTFDCPCAAPAPGPSC